MSVRTLDRSMGHPFPAILEGLMVGNGLYILYQPTGDGEISIGLFLGTGTPLQDPSTDLDISTPLTAGSLSVTSATVTATLI